MELCFYDLNRIRGRLSSPDSNVLSCQFAGALKTPRSFDDPSVYNEPVASRLAGLLGAPIAPGFIVSTPSGFGFATPFIGTPGVSLTRLKTRDDGDVFGQKYPLESAITLIFDRVIGNSDRLGNCFCNLQKETPYPVFVCIDHASGLLGAINDWKSSLEYLLESHSLQESHPFDHFLPSSFLEAALIRVRRLSGEMIDWACRLPFEFPGAPEMAQEQLSDVLRRRVGQIVQEHQI